MKRKDSNDFEILFDSNSENDTLLKSKFGIMLYRTKTISAGEYKYVSIYPIWDTRISEVKRIAKNVSRDAQVKLNEKNSRLRFEQLVNANFKDGDLFLTLTYADDAQPADDKQARQDMKNFLKRVRRHYERIGCELKYAYCQENTFSEERGNRYHFHMIMSGEGVDRDAVEKLWHSGHVNSRRCVTDKNGLAGLAQYMTKQKRNRHARAWSCSQNLVRPQETYANHKIKPSQVTRIEQGMDEYGKRVLEKAYDGFEVTEDIVCRRSDWVNGLYITAKLRKRAKGCLKQTNRKC